MPRMTVRYEFEWEIWKWTQEVVHTMTGKVCAFLILIDDDNAVSQIIFEKGLSFNLEKKDELTRSVSKWFFYNPFDYPEYAAISWNNLEQDVFERLMGSPLTIPKNINGTLIDGIDEFPTTWHVIF